MGGFKIPLDAYIVAIPTLYALTALTGLVYKSMTADPELSTAKYYERPEAEIAAEGESWNNSVSSLFKDRVKRHQWGVFNNDYNAAK